MAEETLVIGDMIIEHVIKRYPQALGLLVRNGIDCCCGAYQSLEKGAAEAGVDLTPLLQELNRVAAQEEEKAAPKRR